MLGSAVAAAVMMLGGPLAPLRFLSGAMWAVVPPAFSSLISVVETLLGSTGVAAALPESVGGAFSSLLPE